MSAKTSFPSSTSSAYQITVEGKIDPSWAEWLGGMQLFSRKEDNGMYITILSGVLSDQAALRGVLNHLWDLNLVVRSVKHVDPKTISNTK